MMSIALSLTSWPVLTNACTARIHNPGPKSGLSSASRLKSTTGSMWIAAWCSSMISRRSAKIGYALAPTKTSIRGPMQPLRPVLHAAAVPDRRNGISKSRPALPSSGYRRRSGAVQNCSNRKESRNGTRHPAGVGYWMRMLHARRRHVGHDYCAVRTMVDREDVRQGKVVDLTTDGIPAR